MSLVLAVLGAAGYFGYQEYQKRQAEADSARLRVGRRSTRGDISATVSATGAVLPEREVNLAFAAAGTIDEVNARGGRAGQGRATCSHRSDTTDLELAVRQAEIGVKQAQAQLQQLQEGPRTRRTLLQRRPRLASSQGRSTSAQANYQQTLKGPDKDTLAAAQAQVDQARVQLQQAQQAYDRVKDRPDVGLLPQSVQLQNATIALETAEAQYRAAEKSVTSAQVAGPRVRRSLPQRRRWRRRRRTWTGSSGAASEGQLAVARAGVDQAMLTPATGAAPARTGARCSRRGTASSRR